MEVRPEGVFLIDGMQDRGFRSPQLPPALVSATRWQVDDAGLLWIGQNVAVGDSGAVLLGGKELNNEGVSAHPTGDAGAIFDFGAVGADKVRVAVADRANLGAALITTNTLAFPNYDFEPVLHVWDTAGTGLPAFSASLPLTGNVTSGFVGMSDTGDRIVAVASSAAGTNHIRVYNPTGAILNSYDVPAPANIRQGRIDDVAGRLYLGLYDGTCEIYDLNTGALLHSQSLAGTFDSHAFSGDGLTFAYGNFSGLFVVQETSPGVWTQVASRFGSGFTYLATCALDARGSRVAFQVQQYSPAYDTIDAGMLDVATGADLFVDTLVAPGTAYQMVCSGVAIDDAGDYMACASWGDSFNTTPEIFGYDSSGTQTMSIDAPGSAFSIDIDADGDVVAAGTKAVHANVSGNGGTIWCVDAYDQELHVLGQPQVGGTLSLETPDGVPSVSFALGSVLGATPTVIGPSEVDLGSLYTSPLGPIAIPVGGLVQPLSIPPSGALIGAPLHVQAVRFGTPATWTNKVSLRLLP